VNIASVLDNQGYNFKLFLQNDKKKNQKYKLIGRTIKWTLYILIGV